MEVNMFRYLLRYVGKYRVLSELTTDTNDFIRDESGDIHPEYDELYMPCVHDSRIVSSCKKNELAFISDTSRYGKKIVNQFKENNITCEVDDSADEIIIYFDSKFLSKVDKIVKIKTKGKKIHPFDEKNIPDRIIIDKIKTVTPLSVSYKIPTQELSMYYNNMALIKDKAKKSALNKTIADDFLTSLKDETYIEKYKNSMLPTREYIHYAGLWDKFITYVKERALIV